MVRKVFFYYSKQQQKDKENCLQTCNNSTHLAKLLKAADCGLMQSGTRPVCNCSAMNLCISSVQGEKSKSFKLIPVRANDLN